MKKRGAVSAILISTVLAAVFFAFFTSVHGDDGDPAPADVAPGVTVTLLSPQIRTDGPEYGLRFRAKFTKTLQNDPDVSDIVYGFALLPEDALPQGELLTLDTVPASPGVPLADVRAENIFSETDSDLTVTAVISGITSDNTAAMARCFVARPYVRFTFGGEEYVVYSETQKKASVNSVLDPSIVLPRDPF